MPEYQWAERNGNIVLADYNRSIDTLTPEQVHIEVENAFNALGNTVEMQVVSTEMNEVYKVNVPNGKDSYSIYVSVKGTTPGGRNNLMDEQRIQQKCKYLNFAYEKLQNGEKAISLGVYKRNGETIFCAWKLRLSNAASPDTPVSKQIKITSIAQAMREGFVQQDKGHGEYACAFRKEFLYFYIKNAEWLHTGHVSELSQHTIPLAATVESELSQHTVLLAATVDIDESIKNKYNRIIFGAPGTGKSYKLEKDKTFFNGNFERVTFHPNYSYAQFVGTYKPVPVKELNADGIEITTITYKYVPGPFMRTYIKARNNLRSVNPQPCLLLIEEINRANVAAVFGDVFQLLDRKNGISEYEIETSEDMRAYLQEELGGDLSEYEKIHIPNNMYIWATMNSADQGVFPMDTAFKRRWDFEYIGINDNAEEIKDVMVKLGTGAREHNVNWNKLRMAINDKLSSKECKVNEDKLLGPYFLSKEVIKTNEEDNFVADNKRFIEAFKSKVLMYLYEDAAKQHKSKIFVGCDHTKYSSVCDAFEELGAGIFGEDIRAAVIEEE